MTLATWPTGLVVAIDTREKRPWRFPRSQTATLATGDYSIIGMEDAVCIERKSKADAFASLGRESGRFSREWARMAAMRYAAVVIESDMRTFMEPLPHGRMPPALAMTRLADWSVRYRVPVVFASDRRHATAWTRRVLMRLWSSARSG